MKRNLINWFSICFTIKRSKNKWAVANLVSYSPDFVLVRILCRNEQEHLGRRGV